MTLAMNTFRAFRIHEVDRKIVAALRPDHARRPLPGRRGRACQLLRHQLQGRAGRDGHRTPILRKYPLVGGIDLAGEVVSSADPRYAPGQQVLVTGCGLSETHDGGYAEFARVQGDWVIPLPPGLANSDSMKLGTAGFTAALAIHRMEQNGQRPANGPIVVTGADGRRRQPRHQHAGGPRL